MRNRSLRLVQALVLAPFALALATTGVSCSKSSSTAPVLPPDELNALPEVPSPSAPHATPPMYSASTLVARPHAADFNPYVAAVKGSWKVYVYQMRLTTPGLPCAGDRVLAYTGESCCHDLPDVTVTVPGCGLLADLTHTFELSPTKHSQPLVRPRYPLMVNGSLRLPPTASDGWGESECLTGVGSWCLDMVEWECHYDVTGRRLQAGPYLQRERFWERVPMDDQGLAAVWLVGDDTFDITTTYRAGSDSMVTNSFAKSVKVGAEGTFKVLKLSAEAAIQKTYSTSVTLSASEERSYQKHLVGDAGKLTCHTLWSLVDQYRWVDAAGNPYRDPNYEFEFGAADPRGRPVELEIRGQQFVLMKTVFDQNGIAERSERIAAL